MIGQSQASGGSIYIQGNEQNNSDVVKTIALNNITVTNTNSDAFGGFLSINYPGLMLSISNVNVTTASANDGGLIYAS